MPTINRFEKSPLAPLWKRLSLPAAIALLFWGSTAFAQSGCDQFSPENPTLVLGLIGAGIASLPMIRSRIRNYRRSASTREPMSR